MTGANTELLRWEFLQPWTIPLRHRTSSSLCRLQPSPFAPAQLYVSVDLCNCGIESEARVLEGLKLLAAVAYVDYNAWKLLLINHCGVKLGESWEEDAESEIIAQYQLRVFSTYRTALNLAELCGVQQHVRSGRDYFEALARIAAMDTKLHTKRCGMEILVPVQVDLAQWDEGRSLGELLSFRDAREMIRRGYDDTPLPPVQAGAFRCTFVLSPTEIKLEDYRIDLDMAKKMEELVHSNVWFSRISLKLDLDYKVTRDTRPKRECLRLLMTSLFDTTRRSNESPTRYLETHTLIERQQLDRISLSSVGQTLAKEQLSALSRNEWGALCSVAVRSQTVRELELSHVASSWDSKHWWEWIAYAFFSKRARSSSSLEGLALKHVKSMTTAEIEAFCAILASENPEEELIGCSSGATGVQDATLAANSPIRWDFDEQNEPVLSSDVLRSASPTPFLRILSGSEDSEWVDAIVPGYGRCQVQRENLVLSEQVDIPPANTLRALEIHFELARRQAMDIDGLPLFFATVGSFLETLTIDTENIPILVDLKMVLEKCPNLKHLCLKRQQEVAVFNFSDFHAAGAPLPTITFDFGNSLAFIEELRKTDSALTNCLQRLTLHQDFPYGRAEDGRPPEHRRKLEALLKMLETNDRLECLCVKVYFGSEEFIKRFGKFRLQPINCSVKLNAHSKIAFLSVLSTTSFPQNEKRKRGCQVGNTRRNWDGFDANVVTNIFQFAAAPGLRNVHCKMAF